ncbi:MAG: hypothetical protein GY851_12505 [bacterium]|nr:hypothetical protein [bacterium]
MSEERRRILDMLANGKVTVDEAERLMAAVGADAAEPGAAPGTGPKHNPKYLRVVINEPKGDRVNVQVPVGLIRAGVKLASLIPQSARDEIDEKMREKGMEFDINNLTPEALDELTSELAELEVDIHSENGGTVRVFCE